ncbi:hypothetical protein [Nocardia salmonicida]|uniref:hypothetical protein n=1 Tax=Nocardia salmonicida TaxID=53431 RepID=UPI002E2B2400|nr:hypothetical protein [Nocardia salmonicida]
MSAPVRIKRSIAGAVSADGSDRPIKRKSRTVTTAPDVSDYLDEIVDQAPPMSAQAHAKLAALLGRLARRAA